MSDGQPGVNQLGSDGPEVSFWITSDFPTIPELARLLFMRAFRGSNPKTSRITFT